MKHMMLLIATIFLFLNTVSAGDGTLKEVDVAMLTEEFHSVDKDAHAAYLSHEAKVTFEYKYGVYHQITHYVGRIKIYSIQGEAYGVFSIGLNKEGRKEEVVYDIAGRTYNYQNDEIVQSELKESDIYSESISDNYNLRTWAMPDVREGSVIDIEYKIKRPWVYTIPRFDFQMGIPVNNASFSLQPPKGFYYKSIQTGKLELKRTDTDKPGLNGITVFSAENIPAMEDDYYVLNINDYRASVKHEISKTDITFDVQRIFSKTWDQIGKNLMADELFGSQLDMKMKGVNSFVRSLKGKTREEKIALVYSHIQKEYHWNGGTSVYAEIGRKDLMKNKVGNVADINLMLISLLNKVGVEAKPFLTKTRDEGLLRKEISSLSELNYVVGYIETEGGFLLLDATSKYIQLGLLPPWAINAIGLLLSENESRVVTVENPNDYIVNTRCKYEIDLEESSLNGGGWSRREKYAATEYRIEKDFEDEEEYGSEDEDGVENEIEYTLVNNLEDIDQPIYLEFDEKIFNEVAVIEDEIFIDAMVDFGIEENPFFQNERDMPIFFGTMPDIRQVINIKIPEGYEVQDMPDSEKVLWDDDKFMYSYSSSKIEDSLKIEYVLKIGVDTIYPEDYLKLKNAYDKMVRKSKEKIILQRT